MQNKEKRVKKFNKDLFMFVNHPNFKDVRELYVNDLIKNIASAEKTLRDIRITNKGEVFKNSIANQQKVKKQIKIMNEKKNNIKIKNFVAERIIKLDYDKIINKGYGYLTHRIEFNLLRETAPNCYYVQEVSYYDGNNKLIIDGDFAPQTFDYIYRGKNEYNDFIKNTVNYQVHKFESAEGTYRPFILVNESGYNEYNNLLGHKAYTIIKTIAYKKEQGQSLEQLQQIYKDSDSGHCVYDAFVNYFKNKINESEKINRHAKAIYNKLIKSEEGLKFKKSYTDKTLYEIANFCQATIKIKDLINGNDKEIKTDYARYYIELINTKYNHLDLLTHNYKDVEEVDDEKYLDIKKNSPFYIEKNGSLITIDKTYVKTKKYFNKLFYEWKNENNFNQLFIYDNSDAYKVVANYDYVLHTFFHRYEVNNELYNEIDLKKAYYNYSNKNINKFYNGVPSGSFITFKCNNDFDIQTFNTIYNNNLIGYFEVKINKHLSKQEHFNILGLNINSVHVLTSAQIYLLKDYIEFEFLNVSYAPSVDIPFDERFLEKDEEGCKHYCRAYGNIIRKDNEIDITIKPLNKDINYYKTVDNEQYEIYKVNDLVKIAYKNKYYKSYRHIGYYIHSYVRTLIINQLLKMDINDVFGVKLDSIVYKKDAQFDYDQNIFSVKDCKIEKLLKKYDDEFDDDIINDEEDIEDYQSLKNYNYYRSFFKIKYENIELKENFIYSKDIITNRIIFIGGAGGSGKTSSLLRGLDNKRICYTANCWNLITGQRNKNKDIIGFSFPNLTGNCNGKKTEIKKNNNIAYIIVDEMTLNNKEDVEYIINNYTHSYIFLLGDIDQDGTFYQCTLPNINLYMPNENIQYIKYTKSYRFDNELLIKLNGLRQCMKYNFNNEYRNLNILNYVKQHFKDNFFNKENVIFNNNDIGISGCNDLIKNENKLSEYFINKGTKPQYYIKQTNFCKRQFKGQQLDEKPDHSNYEMKLFKTIHSFQGLDLNDNNKIIISITKNFDFNLFYTALSRARRCDQIIILN